MKHIAGWLENRQQRPLLFIIGTHCDKDEEFLSLPEGKIGDYTDKFRSLPIVTELVLRGGGDQLAKVVLGSMKTVNDTEVLVYQIFKQVIS